MVARIAAVLGGPRRALALACLTAAIAVYTAGADHLWRAGLWPDIFLLKYEPKPSEVQEGVAFYGRAGQALLKSLQRLRVDPMSVYGTNCLKFAGQDPEEARPWLTRELHIVQPKLFVLMGEPTVEFTNAIAFPLSDPVDPAAEGLQRFTATVEALVVPDIDAALDEAPAKTAFWNAFKALGPWWQELPPY